MRMGRRERCFGVTLSVHVNRSAALHCGWSIVIADNARAPNVTND